MSLDVFQINPLLLLIITYICSKSAILKKSRNDLALHTAFTIYYNKMKTTNEMRIIADGTFESAKIEIIGVS